MSFSGPYFLIRQKKDEDTRGKGVDKGGARGAKAPPDFLANNIICGCGHAKVDVVVTIPEDRPF